MKARIKFKIYKLDRKYETKLSRYHGPKVLVIREGKRRRELQRLIFGVIGMDPANEERQAHNIGVVS